MESELLQAQKEVEQLNQAFETTFDNLALSSIENEDKYAQIQDLVAEEGETNQKTVNKYTVASI